MINDLLKQAKDCLHKNDLQSAIEKYKAAVKLDSKNVEALSMLGILVATLGDVKESVHYFQKAIAVEPNNIEVLNNFGITLQRAGQFDEAVKLHSKAVALNDKLSGSYFNLASAQMAVNDNVGATANLNKAVSLRSDYFDAHLKLAGLYLGQNNFHAALEVYKRLISLKPNYDRAYYKIAFINYELRNYDEAILNYKKTIELNPNYVEAYYNLGNIYSLTRQYHRALECFNKVLSLKEDHELAFNYKLLCLRYMCLWDHFDELNSSLNDFFNSKKLIVPFIFLFWCDSPEKQQVVAKNYVEKHFDRAKNELKLRPKKSARINLAYISSDFYAHATSFLMAGMIDGHDSDRFNVSLYSSGPPVEDAMRERLMSSAECFVDIHEMSNEQVADQMRKQNISIAIDLKGHTARNRLGILSYKPAPIQICYLGFPGTLGADFIDYAIVDDYVVTESSQRFFSENLIYMPDSYQVNDSHRFLPEAPANRSLCNLPENTFVFACFNNAYKITPDVFQIWMRLLQKIPDSVLWLLEDNPIATKNLCKEAERQGVSVNRIIFSPRKENHEYMAQYHFVDLFLDTLPVNAHTTASDALWVGAPVITCSGESFVARVAGSLLRSVKLPDLIANSLEDYEDLAYSLATNPDRLAAIKKHLKENRYVLPLFDTSKFTKDLELAYQHIWKLYSKGMNPSSFHVETLYEN